MLLTALVSNWGFCCIGTYIADTSGVTDCWVALGSAGTVSSAGGVFECLCETEADVAGISTTSSSSADCTSVCTSSGYSEITLNNGAVELCFSTATAVFGYQYTDGYCHYAAVGSDGIIAAFHDSTYQCSCTGTLQTITSGSDPLDRSLFTLYGRCLWSSLWIQWCSSTCLSAHKLGQALQGAYVRW